ncbi:cytochrome b/b6 domain-containing protein [Granulosicoccus antarcticus]|nr:cytochrome b/b6 domain-containing protein [Granulosicoccus antarcticus]
MNKTSKIRIWDSWVRLFHWSLAISVGFQLLSGETSWQFYDWHRSVGELVLALILFRVLWGFWGSGNARFGQLFHSPKASLLHLAGLFRREPSAERGHNAAGSWAVLTLLLIIMTQAVTGFFIADEDEFIEGALYGSLSGSGTDIAMRIHSLNAQLIQIVVAVHILMVFAYLLYAKQNLIKPMITGWMNWSSDATPPPVTFQKFWVGAVLFAISAAAVGYVAGWFG